MFDHQASSFFTYSSDDLDKIIKYLGKVKLVTNDILCLHFSCHGNSDGIGIGSDFIDWLSFTKLLGPIFMNKKIGKQTFIIISSCGANGQEITDKINSFSESNRKTLNCPTYFFVYNEDKVPWDDALLCWAILYHQLSKLTTINKKNVQAILKKINLFGSLMYFRWDETKLKYLKFIPN
jgi:hypothetical protein